MALGKRVSAQFWRLPPLSPRHSVQACSWVPHGPSAPFAAAVDRRACGLLAAGLCLRTQRRRASALHATTPSLLWREADGPGIELTPTRVDNWRGHTLVLFIRPAEEGQELDLGRMGEAVDKSLGSGLRELLEDFKAEEGSTKVIQLLGKDIKRLVVVGLGTDWRLAGAAVAGTLKEMKGGAVGIACVDGVDVQALVEGALCGLHVDERFRGSQTKDRAVGPKSLELLGAFPPGSQAAIERAQAVASGVIFARELVNGAPNVVTPPNLAAAAVDLAERTGLTATIADREACEAMGMGAFLAVSNASDLPAQLIHLKYGEGDRKVGIVGKGLTFDSGGYNIKTGPGCMIEMMKFDMGGAAATLGAAAAVVALKPKDVEVHFIVATCENMISGNPGALRPGDIITAMNGTTIEVNNTDAEGRLTLADAMLYCQDQGVTELVDVATLTGACMVALGQNVTGLWSNSDELAEKLDTASKACSEKVWRMPLEQSYFDGLKSDFADMKNAGPRFGGAITAALFLQKFVREGTSWAHLDIAGTAWAEKASGLNSSVGGTGSMVRTLTKFICG